MNKVIISKSNKRAMALLDKLVKKENKQREIIMKRLEESERKFFESRKLKGLTHYVNKVTNARL